MAQELFKYDQMVEEALRGVVRRALRQAAQHGLPGNHHFYITFKTAMPGVAVPDYLVEKYPDEMTIVMQYQFWDLDVRDDSFSVALSFNDRRELLNVPYNAITGFADPSVKFGLQFQPPEDGDTALAELEAEAEADEGAAAAGGESGAAEVVSLDQFRKKK